MSLKDFNLFLGLPSKSAMQYYFLCSSKAKEYRNKRRDFGIIRKVENSNYEGRSDDKTDTIVHIKMNI